MSELRVTVRLLLFFVIVSLGSGVILTAALKVRACERTAEEVRHDLARQRAAMLHALRQIAAEESVPMCKGCTEGLHAHSILLLVDRALGTKHRCAVPKEWLER